MSRKNMEEEEHGGRGTWRKRNMENEEEDHGERGRGAAWRRMNRRTEEGGAADGGDLREFIVILVLFVGLCGVCGDGLHGSCILCHTGLDRLGPLGGTTCTHRQN